MTKIPRPRRSIPALSKDTIHPLPTLPDASSLIDMGFPLTAEEMDLIRMAMAIHSAARKPQITWAGWKHIAVATAIGSERAREASGGRMDTPNYRSVMSDFLKKTGFIFLNKVDRALAVRLLPRWDEIDAWRSSLPQLRQGGLNNPREVWKAFLEHRKALGDPEAKERPAAGKRRKFPSLLEQAQALAEALEAAIERAERAEAESVYFADLMTMVAKKAKFSDADVDHLRAEVRARVRAQQDDSEPDPD